MDDLPSGLYERIVTEELATTLSAIDSDLVSTRSLKSYEAPDRVALYLANLIRRALEDVAEDSRVTRGVELARDLAERLALLLAADTDLVLEPGTVLDAILRRQPDGRPELIPQPLISLLETTLLTNAPGEPNLWNQFQGEIHSADSVDVVMAFIRKSGINPLVQALRQHCQSGRSLRILTTTYTGSTEQAALDVLTELGAQVKVSYDTSSTRLHAKAWLFHRPTGHSTAFIGSSNLTFSAQVDHVP